VSEWTFLSQINSLVFTGSLVIFLKAALVEKLIESFSNAIAYSSRRQVLGMSALVDNS
jgi:hypothetical protein